MQESKKWFESKSVWLGLLILILSIISFIVDEEWIKDYPKVVAILSTVVGVLTIVLRYLAINPMKATMEIKEVGAKEWLRQKRSGFKKQ